MEMQQVKSSNVSAIGYDEDSQTLQVLFKNGATYQYFDVPEQIYDGLIQQNANGESVGRYLNSNVKGSYRFSRV